MNQIKSLFDGGPLDGAETTGHIPLGTNIQLSFTKVDHADGAGHNTIPKRGTYLLIKDGTPDNTRTFKWKSIP